VRIDGVQWDYEFAENRGQGLLKLLDETRQRLPNTFISVATPMWYPGTLWGWDADYFKEVARRCDQIAVMCYDSGFFLPRSYVWLIEQQAIVVTTAVADSNSACRVQLGIPTYEKGIFAHSNWSETVEMALKGVREGLSDPRAHREVFDGVTPFAEYTTSPDEWAAYEKWWIQPTK
jgi:hypothetical protein